MRVLTIVFAILACLVPSAYGDDVYIVHKEDSGNKIQYASRISNLSETNRVTIPKHQSSDLMVRNQNPILFDYNIESTKFVELPDTAVIKKLFDAFKEFSNLDRTLELNLASYNLEGIQNRPICAPLLLNEINLNDGIDSILFIGNALEQLPELIDKSLNFQSQELDPISNWKKGAETTIFFTDKLAESYQHLLQLNKIELTIGNTTEQVDIASINKRALELLDHNDPECQRQKLRWTLAWELRRDTGAWKAYAEAIQQFAEMYAQVGTNRVLNYRNKAVTYKWEPDREWQIGMSIKRNNTYSRYFSIEAKEVQNKHITDGVNTVVFQPQRTARYEASIGMIYSYVKNPEFSAAMGDDGMLKVALTENERTKLENAVAVNIFRGKDYGSDFRPFLQIGVSPKSEPALLLGLGLKLSDNYSLAAGVAFQEITKLDGGLSIGDPLENSDALKTRDSYDTGLYINFGFNFDL